MILFLKLYSLIILWKCDLTAEGCLTPKLLRPHREIKANAKQNPFTIQYSLNNSFPRPLPFLVSFMCLYSRKMKESPQKTIRKTNRGYLYPVSQNMFCVFDLISRLFEFVFVLFVSSLFIITQLFIQHRQTVSLLFPCIHTRLNIVLFYFIRRQ